MLDNYLITDCNRISPEAPVQVLDITDESNLLGGAGNVLNNLVSLGSDVTMISVLGDDDTATEILKILKELKVSSEYIYKDKSRTTSKKSRLISSNQQIVRFDRECKSDISREHEDTIIKNLGKIIGEYSVLIFSDYAKGILTNRLCKYIIEIANNYDIKVLVDPKGSDYSKYSGAYMLTPNKKEAVEATGIEFSSSDVKEVLDTFKKRYKITVPLVTLSEDGISYFNGSKYINIPTKAEEVYDVTGAGDTVIASIAYMLSVGSSLHNCINFANSAAAVVIKKSGSATTTLSEVENYNKRNREVVKSHEVLPLDELCNIVKKVRESGGKIIFTNGCFDILHYGHVSYLKSAKELGDILIVGINSDSSVSRLKGSSRPINSEYDRSHIVASLSAVDYTTIFSEDTPLQVIEAIKPDILVKGADYKGKEVVGSDIVKEVVLIDFIDGKSTTKIIDKIDSSRD